MEYGIIGILLLGAVWLGYGIGCYLSNKFEDQDNTSELKNTLDDLYCFECEIEMPVKEKNGRLCCSNCGLRH